MKVTELAAHWRATAARLEDKPNVASLRPYITQLTQCADELEAALRPRVLSDEEVARLTEGTDD